MCVYCVSLQVRILDTEVDQFGSYRLLDDINIHRDRRGPEL